MLKKLSFMTAVVTALAFAVPLMASAAVPTLQNLAGSPVPTGTTVRATGSFVSITSTTLGQIVCKKLTFESKLSVNDMTNGFTSSLTGPGQENLPQEECKNGTNNVLITNSKITDLKSTAGGEATFSFVWTVDIGSTMCSYTGTNVKGTYANGGSILTFAGAYGVTSSPAACGTAKRDGEFKLESTTGETFKGVYL